MKISNKKIRLINCPMDNVSTIFRNHGAMFQFCDLCAMTQSFVWRSMLYNTRVKRLCLPASHHPSSTPLIVAYSDIRNRRRLDCNPKTRNVTVGIFIGEYIMASKRDCMCGSKLAGQHKLITQNSAILFIALFISKIMTKREIFLSSCMMMFPSFVVASPQEGVPRSWGAWF